MRFCIVTPLIGRNDGQGRVNLEIAAEAVRQGHDVTLISERVSGLPAEVLQKAVVLSPPSWLPTRMLRDQLFAWRSRAALARDVGQYDAVLANGAVTWGRCDLNAVHFVHSSWLRSPYHPWRLHRSARSLYARVYSRLNATLEQASFRRSTRVIAVSQAVGHDLRQINVPANRICVISNGVDTVEFHPGGVTRGELGLPDAVIIALFAGDLRSPRKNLETVLRAMPMVPELHLAVAGREAGTPYPELARTLGISERVHFLGFRKDMPALMRASDLFVFPSRYEACSLVLLEALASGMPVITARSAGGSELIDPQVGVVLDDSDDVDGLAATLRSLVTDKERRQAMAKGARSLAETHTWSVMANRYVELLVEAGLERRGTVHA